MHLVTFVKSALSLKSYNCNVQCITACNSCLRTFDDNALLKLVFLIERFQTFENIRSIECSLGVVLAVLFEFDRRVRRHVFSVKSSNNADALMPTIQMTRTLLFLSANIPMSHRESIFCCRLCVLKFYVSFEAKNCVHLFIPNFYSFFEGL